MYQMEEPSDERSVERERQTETYLWGIFGKVVVTPTHLIEFRFGTYGKVVS